MSWRRKDASLLRACPWSDVEGDVIDRDARNATLVLRGGQDRFVVGAATSAGQAFGLFDFGRLEELADARVRSGQPVSYGPTLERVTGRSLAKHGTIACRIAVGLQSATTPWAPGQSGPRRAGMAIAPVLAPSAIGLVGAIRLVVGALIHCVLGDNAMPIWFSNSRGKLALAGLAVLVIVRIGFLVT